MCTGIRFTDDAGNLYFGRNLDWTTPFGESIFATKKGFSHEKFLNNEIKTAHECIGVGICLDGFPLYFDVGNDKGLACAGLNFPGYAKYESAPVKGKKNVPSYMFPLYVVGQFETVDEVEKELAEVAITAQQFNPDVPAQGIHWIISDAKRCIVVEYMADGMHVYDNDLNVLANQPTFPYHHENVRNYISLTPEFPENVTWGTDVLSPYGSGSGMRGMPGDFYSPSRFVRAAYFNSHYPSQTGEKDNVLRTFKTLQGAAMIFGGAKMGDGKFEFTTYTSCFSPSTMSYFYSTYEDPTIRKFELSSADYSNGDVAKVTESA